MTITVKQIIPCKQLEASLTNQFTVTSLKAVVDKMTITNISAVNVLFSLHLVPLSGSPDGTNLLIKEISLAPNQTYLCPESIGHVLETGDSIQTLASLGASLVFCASGRLIT